MGLNPRQYLFGFEFQCLCVACPGAVRYIASYVVSTVDSVLHVPLCGLCTPHLFDRRAYTRWIT